MSYGPHDLGEVEGMFDSAAIRSVVLHKPVSGAPVHGTYPQLHAPAHSMFGGLVKQLAAKRAPAPRARVHSYRTPRRRELSGLGEIEGLFSFVGKAVKGIGKAIGTVAKGAAKGVGAVAKGAAFVGKNVGKGLVKVGKFGIPLVGNAVLGFDPLSLFSKQQGALQAGDPNMTPTGWSGGWGIPGATSPMGKPAPRPRPQFPVYQGGAASSGDSSQSQPWFTGGGAGSAPIFTTPQGGEVYAGSPPQEAGLSGMMLPLLLGVGAFLLLDKRR